MPTHEKLVSINEREERHAQKLFYEKIEADMNMKKLKKLQFLQDVSIRYSPIFVIVFMVIYWIAGLKNADIL